MTETVAVLEQMGHAIEASHPSALRETEHSEASRVIVAAHVATEIAHWESELGRPITDDELSSINASYRDRNRGRTPADYVAAEAALHAYARRLLSWWVDDGFDLLVLPVASVPPPPLGWFNLPDEHGRWPNVFNYTGPFNVTGQPAIALPVRSTEDGLPIGVQLVAAPGREDVLVAVAAAVEAAIPWAERRPSAIPAL